MNERKKSEKKVFTDDFLVALSNWQKGWYEVQASRRKIADKLIEQCALLPTEFTEFNGGALENDLS